MSVTIQLQEKLRFFEDLKKQLQDIAQKIGILKEQETALFQQAWVLKGGIETLLALQEDEKKALETSKTAKLTLPEGVKPVVAPTPLEVV